METKVIYRAITFEAKSCREIDNLVNTFLRDEADIAAISISHSTVQAEEENEVHILYTAMLLYSFKD